MAIVKERTIQYSLVYPAQAVGVRLLLASRIDVPCVVIEGEGGKDDVPRVDRFFCARRIFL